MTTPQRPTRPTTLDPLRVQQWRAAAYEWPCPQCACDRNLRGLLRPQCAHCGHEHRPTTTTEVSHVD